MDITELLDSVPTPSADELIFWKVESKSIPGGVGWTAEGDGKDYYLNPYK